MKRKLHLFSLLFLAAFLLVPVRTMAQVTIGNYTYTFSGDDATITASSLTSGDIVIPTTVSYNGKTYNVTAISFGRGALFKNNSQLQVNLLEQLQEEVMQLAYLSILQVICFCVKISLLVLLLISLILFHLRIVH